VGVRRCDEMKMSPEAAVIMAVTTFAQKVLPAAAFQKAAFDSFDKLTLLFTNVQGPEEEQWFLGRPVDSFAFFVPALMSTCVGAVSYKGNMYFSVVTDSDVVPDPDVFCKGLVDELEKLRHVADTAVTPSCCTSLAVRRFATFIATLVLCVLLLWWLIGRSL